MYGSQFHFEQALTNQRAATVSLSKNVSLPKKDKRPWLIALLTIVTISISTIACAGPSQPKISGGNGNANGR